MIENVILTPTFSKMMSRHIEDIINELFKKEISFGVICNTYNISFEPELPPKLKDALDPMTLFFLAGYTYETALLNENYLEFEAGFGKENFGSLVNIPLINIMQIIVDDMPIFLNRISPLLTDDSVIEEPTKNKDGIKKSMNALLNNPENQQFKK